MAKTAEGEALKEGRWERPYSESAVTYKNWDSRVDLRCENWLREMVHDKTKWGLKEKVLKEGY